MDETAIAFAPLHARAAASHNGAPLDRISVRDYVRAVDIGAFRAEQGVPQRIRFNVVLEVSHHAAAATDDVDQVVSYDSITEAIEAALTSGRTDLLETLAERVARGCLADPRVVRAFVRVEKLDRIPGALGVEIVRVRLPEDAARLRPPATAPVAGPRARRLVVYLPAEAIRTDGARVWRQALAGEGWAAVICTDPGTPQPAVGGEGPRRAGLLAIDQAAWLLADLDPGFQVVASRTELEHAIGGDALPIWAPARMAAEAQGAPGADDPARLASWLAAEIRADALVLVGTETPAGTAVPVHLVGHPEDLVAI